MHDDPCKSTNAVSVQEHSLPLCLLKLYVYWPFCSSLQGQRATILLFLLGGTRRPSSPKCFAFFHFVLLCMIFWSQYHLFFLQCSFSFSLLLYCFNSISLPHWKLFYYFLFHLSLWNICSFNFLKSRKHCC